MTVEYMYMYKHTRTLVIENINTLHRLVVSVGIMYTYMYIHYSICTYMYVYCNGYTCIYSKVYTQYAPGYVPSSSMDEKVISLMSPLHTRAVHVVTITLQ